MHAVLAMLPHEQVRLCAGGLKNDLSPVCYNAPRSGASALKVYLNLALIIVSISLIIMVVLQSRGIGLGGLGGGDFGGSGYHVRRGVERLIFNITIGLSVTFFVLAILNVTFPG